MISSRRKPIMKQSPLKRKTSLKSKKPMNKISEKQNNRIKQLRKIEPPEDNRCQECHQLPDFRGLQKHHKIFRSHNGNDSKENIIFLCGKCHSKFHGIIEKPIDNTP